MQSIVLLTLLSFCCMVGCNSIKTHVNAEMKLETVSVSKIWDGAPHNAFTDLVHHNGEWFCTFREAERHQGTSDGKIRVIVSSDGKKWESAALLFEDGIDLRDPKFSLTPDNRLMLTIGGSVYRGGRTLLGKQPRVCFSQDGRQWTQPKRVCDEGDWLWRVTWHDGHAYGIVYRSSDVPDWSVRLVESKDGLDFHTVTDLVVPDHPNEATVRFLDDGKCIALVRREAGDKSAWIGQSAPPYKQWSWESAGMFVGGPNFLVLPDGRMVASGRQLLEPGSLHGLARTFVGKMTLESISPQLALPSGGDCSYPGLVWRDGQLWVSYYSSHEGRTSIYLARIVLK
jgi:hypothetical protein